MNFEFKWIVKTSQPLTLILFYAQTPLEHTHLKWDFIWACGVLSEESERCMGEFLKERKSERGCLSWAWKGPKSEKGNLVPTFLTSPFLIFLSLIAHLQRGLNVGV